MNIKDFASSLTNDKRFNIVISCIIIINCVILGIQTLPISSEASQALNIADVVCLAIYVIEIVLRFISSPSRYFRSAWNIFDVTVVLLSILPSLLPFPPQIARLIRIFRTLRVLLLVSALDPLRRIITSLVKSLPSIFWTVFLLVVICYIYGIMGFYLFGQDYPDYFGSLGSTLFTLFQLTTLENWADVAREVMISHPFAAAYFVSFILIAAFIIVNVVTGIIVSSLEETARSETNKKDGSSDSSDSGPCGKVLDH